MSRDAFNAVPRRSSSLPLSPHAPVVQGQAMIWAIIAVASLIAMALSIYQLTRPGMLFGLTEYDDGVYFGSAIRLVNGALPYRDFVLVQPPGFVLLASPVALLSRVIGTRDPRSPSTTKDRFARQSW